MKRSDFLKNALMAVAVSLLPEILRPATKWIAGESELRNETWFIPKYDPNKHYKKQYLGNAHIWYSGEALSYLDKWECEQRKKLLEKWLTK